MNSINWLQVKEIFSAALDLPPAEREDFIREKCGDEAIIVEVESLLAAYEEADNFIESPAFRPVQDFVKDGQRSSMSGKIIGVYKIEKEIGRGGMGAVYLARRADREFEKRVAVKLIKRGLDTDDIIRRFRQERQILATLDHPNITRLIDGGATEDGLPFLVVDYVEGMPLNKYCAEKSLSIKDKLKLFLQICSAVSYAHQNLIIHRDIKPSNILVTNEGVPKLLDFGIAKLLETDASATLDPTQTATQVMTPAYASPEQVLGQPLTTATDVYSLGIVLYELLTGQRAFKLNTSSSPEKIVRVITGSEPPKPSSVAEPEKSSGGNNYAMTKAIRSQLRGDLDNIVLMAMRKEPDRRYASVEQFASDITRYLEGLPVLARQDTFAYRASKFVSRNKAAVAAGTGVAISLIAGIAATTRQARIARREREIADNERDKARTEARKAEKVSRFLQQMLGSADPRAQGKDVRVVEILNLAAGEIEKEFARQPEIAAGLHATLGKTYLSLGLLDKAEWHFKNALDLNLQLFGNNHRETALSRNNLGKILYDKGSIEPAEDLFREALSIMHDNDEKDSLETAFILSNLGDLLLFNGDYEEFLEVNAREFLIRKNHQGEDHPDVARLLNSLAHGYGMLGRWKEAENLSRQSLAIFQNYYKGEHMDVAQAMFRLAVQYLRNDHFEESEKLLYETLSMQHKLLGKDHPDVAWTLYNLSFLKYREEKFEESEKFAREILALRGKNFHDEHSVVSSSLQMLALSLKGQGKPEQAAPLLRDSLEMRRRTLPPEHFLIATSSSLLGECLAEIGQKEEAEKLLFESYQTLKEKLGADHEHTRNALERIKKYKSVF